MNYDAITDQEMIFFLCSLPSLGYASVKRLFERISPLHSLLLLPEGELKKRVDLKEKQVFELLSLRKNTESLHEAYLNLEREQISFLTPLDPDYPKKLLFTPDYPFGLFVKGSIPQDKKSVAIVGSRSATEYGLQMAEFLAKVLAEHDVDIISGLALGIDASAHWGALKARGGKTYGVLGTGINICYPHENFPLFRQLSQGENGGILSEFFPGTNPLRINFPIRNRIISGLSDIVLVVEARLRSGSLITANHAIDQGRDVFALPGRITDPLSLGCNRLIAEGAGILSSPADILEALELCHDKKLSIRQKTPNMLAKNEKVVYSCLDLKPKYIDDIMHETKMELSPILNALLLLELEGYIVQVSSHYYCKRVTI